MFHAFSSSRCFSVSSFLPSIISFYFFFLPLSLDIFSDDIFLFSFTFFHISLLSRHYAFRYAADISVALLSIFHFADTLLNIDIIFLLLLFLLIFFSFVTDISMIALFCHIVLYLLICLLLFSHPSFFRHCFSLRAFDFAFSAWWCFLRHAFFCCYAYVFLLLLIFPRASFPPQLSPLFHYFQSDCAFSYGYFTLYFPLSILAAFFPLISPSSQRSSPPRLSFFTRFRRISSLLSFSSLSLADDIFTAFSLLFPHAIDISCFSLIFLLLLESLSFLLLHSLLFFIFFFFIIALYYFTSLPFRFISTRCFDIFPPLFLSPCHFFSFASLIFQISL